MTFLYKILWLKSDLFPPSGSLHGVFIVSFNSYHDSTLAAHPSGTVSVNFCSKMASLFTAWFNDRRRVVVKLVSTSPSNTRLLPSEPHHSCNTAKQSSVLLNAVNIASVSYDSMCLSSHTGPGSQWPLVLRWVNPDVVSWGHEKGQWRNRNMLYLLTYDT